MSDLSKAEARRIALAAQCFADSRATGRVDIRKLRHPSRSKKLKDYLE